MMLYFFMLPTSLVRMEDGFCEASGLEQRETQNDCVRCHREQSRMNVVCNNHAVDQHRIDADADHDEKALKCQSEQAFQIVRADAAPFAVAHGCNGNRRNAHGAVNKDSNERGKTDGCWHSSTGVSPRPMLMGAAHNALWAFNARVSLTLPVRCRPQAATLALRPGVIRSIVWGPRKVARLCGVRRSSVMIELSRLRGSERYGYGYSAGCRSVSDGCASGSYRAAVPWVVGLPCSR